MAPAATLTLAATLKDRKVVNIDRDNFNDVLGRSSPRLALKVQNRLTDENSQLAVELNFNSIEDFEPARVASQVAPLRELLDMRQRLTAGERGLAADRDVAVLVEPDRFDAVPLRPAPELERRRRLVGRESDADEH